MVSLLIVRLLALKTVVTITSIYVISYLHVFKNLSHLYKFQISSLHKSFSFINFSVQIFHHCYKYPPGVFHKKKLFSNILWYSQENTCVGVSFLVKLQAFRPVTILKRDSNTDIFLWISGNLQEHQFWRAFANGCFCNFGKYFVRTFLRS